MSSELDSGFVLEVRRLLEEYRAQCLWFLRNDYVPSEPADVLRILETIEARADRSGYVRARRLKQWLLQRSSAPSAAR
jgi:hypothetical protein